MWSKETILEYLKENLSEKRYIHCLGVQETAGKLAEHYGADVNKASLAGLIHDCAKYMKSNEILDELEKRGETIDFVTRRNPQIMHGYMGAIVAKNLMGVEDAEVLSAIKYHVTGRENMTMLEKIVFIGDYIEPSRDFKGVNEARKITFENINEGVLYALNNTINYVLDRKQLLHTKTVEARNYLLWEEIEKGNNI